MDRFVDHARTAKDASLPNYLPTFESEFRGVVALRAVLQHGMDIQTRNQSNRYGNVDWKRSMLAFALVLDLDAG